MNNNYTIEENSLILSAILKKISTLEEDLEYFKDDTKYEATKNMLQEDLTKYRNLFDKIKKDW